MCKWLDFENIDTIIELWPWTWAFTAEIVKKAKKDSKIILFELNKDYCKYLNKKYWDKVEILNISADKIKENLGLLWIQKVDLIISWLWFLSMDEKIRDWIVSQCDYFIKKWAKFRGFTYFPKILKKVMKNYKINFIKKIYLNFPPAFIFSIK